MRHPADDLHRRRVIVAGVALVLLVGVTIYAIVANRTHTPSSTPPSPGSTASTPPAVVATTPVITELSALRPTSDPDTFARQVAQAIFAWDTTTLITRSDHVELLVDVADPTGEATPGLVADLGNYLPTQNAWVELAKYQTRQWLDVDTVTTPSTWAEAETQAGESLLPGTSARTIHGTRHRAGIWNDSPVASEHTVAFTVFIVCEPSYPQCRLLRLSMLDNPLE